MLRAILIVLACAITSASTTGFEIERVFQIQGRGKDFLISHIPGSLYLVEHSQETEVFKKLETNTLEVVESINFPLKRNAALILLDVYAFSVFPRNLDNVRNYHLQKISFSGDVQLDIMLTSVTTSNSWVGTNYPIVVGNTLCYFYQNANKLNMTTFVIGKTTKGAEFTISTGDISRLSYVEGGSLGNDKIYAHWFDDNSLKSAVIHVSMGIIGSVKTIENYHKNFNCKTYATNQGFYGDLCYVRDASNSSNMNYFIRTRSNSLVLFANYNAEHNDLIGIHPYGPSHLALVFMDYSMFSYEVWNLDTLTLFKPRTTFLKASMPDFQFVSGSGLYIKYSSKKGEVHVGKIYSDPIRSVDEEEFLMTI